MVVVFFIAGAAGCVFEIPFSEYRPITASTRIVAPAMMSNVLFSISDLHLMLTCSHARYYGFQQGFHLIVCKVIMVEFRIELPGERRHVHIAELVRIENFSSPRDADDLVQTRWAIKPFVRGLGGQDKPGGFSRH